MVKEAVFWEVEMDCEDAIALLGGIKVTRLHYIKEQYPSALLELSLFCTAEERTLFIFRVTAVVLQTRQALY